MNGLIVKKKKKPELVRYVPPGRRTEQKFTENKRQSEVSEVENPTSLQSVGIEDHAELCELICFGLSNTDNAAKTATALVNVFREHTESNKKIRMEFLKKLQGEYSKAMSNCADAPENSLKLFTLLSHVYRFIKISGEPMRVLEKPLHGLAAKLLKSSQEALGLQGICCELIKCFETVDVKVEGCEVRSLLNTMRDLITSENSSEETRSCLVAVLDARAKKWNNKNRAN